MCTAAPHYKLRYFSARGRGEFLRYILAQADVTYEDQMIKLEDWQTVKATLPFGFLPVLEFDGKQLCQSTSIARYLANKFGVNGKTEWDVAYSDMLVQCMEDLNSPFMPYEMAVFTNDEEKQGVEWKKYKEATLTPFFDKLTKQLGDKKFFCGDYVTYADLLIGEFIDRIDKCFDAEFTNHFPKLKQHSQRVHELPNIKKHVEKRPKYQIKI